MPEPITRTASRAPRAVPRQRGRSTSQLLRQLREQDWRTLVETYRLLCRLVVEHTKHHQVDAADDVARQAATVEQELEDLFASRWARRRPDLLLEQARWWAEPHEADDQTCRACQLLPADMSAVTSELPPAWR